MAVPAPVGRLDSPWDLTLQSTDDIVSTLTARGVSLDREQFRRRARSAGSPSALADEWLDGLDAAVPGPPPTDPPEPVACEQPEAPDIPAASSPAGPAEEEAPPDTAITLLTACAWELWRRWAPDLTCAEILAEEFDRHYEPLDNLLMGDPALLREALGRAGRIITACRRPGEPPDADLFQEIWGHCWHDLAVWLRCLPLILARREMLDDAIRLCDRLAPLFEARAFMADKALLLAQAGRVAEARAQVTDNVRRWRRDPVVLRKACETLWSMGHADEALLLYDEVLSAMARPPHPEAGT